MTRAPGGTGRLRGVVAAVVLAVALVSSSAPGASGQGRWAPEQTATIRPGVQMYTQGAQCTANFVFTDRGGRVYLGYAAHCAAAGSATDTDGCRSRSLPLGTRVRFVDGSTQLTDGSRVGRGRLAYSSWRTMRRLGRVGPHACAHNDFALVRVGPRHVGKVNPTVPFWGGPVGLNRAGTTPGEMVHSYGGSTLRPGVGVLDTKTGLALGTTANGWSHPVYAITPGVPGDSGSAFLDAEGRALGVLSTLVIAPAAGSNEVGDMRRQLRFAQRHSDIPGLRLVRGTRGFRRLP